MIKYLLVVLLVVVASITGFYIGTNIVRDGLVANYPTIKNLVNRSYVEVDTVLTIPISAEETPALFENSLVKKTDSPTLAVRVLAKYGTNLDTHFYKINKKGNEIEAMLPNTWVLDYTVLNYTFSAKKLDFSTLNTAANKDMHSLLPLKLEKFKSFHLAAKNKIATALMFYFIPYKFELKVFFSNQQLPLPVVVGLNKDVNEYIGEQVGKR